MSRPHSVTQPFAARLTALVREIYAAPQRAVVGGYVPHDARPTRAEASELHPYIRKLRNHTLRNQPSPQRAFDVGGALGRLTGLRWINPFTMLFMCGHYGLSADLMLRIRPEKIPLRKTLRMVEALATIDAPWPEPMDPAAERAALMAEGYDELSVRSVMKRNAEMPPVRREDRFAWEIDNLTYLELNDMWKKMDGKPDLRVPAVASAQLIADRAEYALDLRQRSVVDLIVGELLRRSSTY